MFRRILIALALIPLFLTACGAAAPALEVTKEIAPMAYDAASQPTMAPVSAGESYAPSPSQPERMVIQDASLSMAVDDPAESMQKIRQMAEDMGGFVVNASLYKTTLDSGAEVPQADITIRVPAERLDEALKLVRAQATQPVLSENINSQDITSEYIDLQSRLTNLEAKEKELQRIMEEATDTQDVLDVYNQLSQTQGEIESIKGQMKYYEQAVALSAITVRLMADEAVQPLKVGEWEVGGVAKNAIQALVNTLKFLVYALEWIALYVLPVMILLALPVVLIYLVVRAILRRRKKKSYTA